MRKPNRLLLLLLLCFSWAIAEAQPSLGGTPPSFRSKSEGTLLKSNLRKSSLMAPNRQKLYEEDFNIQKNNIITPPRVAVILPVNYTTENSGEWTILESGELVWRLTINVPQAIALSLTYQEFKLPKGSKLFIYSANRKQVLGAYTEANNPVNYKEFATELVAGDELTLEYVAPATEARKAKNAEETENGEQTQTWSYTSEPPVISISGIAYAYNETFIHVSTEFYDPDFRTMATPDENNDASGSCMVNINCSEGANWQDEKRGIAATLQKINAGYYICSGTLVNNTSRNTDPYFLMAFHCSNNGSSTASDTDLNQWIFYFHWESIDCERNSPRSAYRTMTGASRLVSIPLGGGSDGLLLKLKNPIPTNWYVYYNGWDRRNVAATSGVGIHHPAGDVKKISTFTDPATSVGGQSFTNYGNTAPNSGWYVKYVATQNGHGIVQGGSSGSPLFNQNKRVIGTLSGGSASCDNPTGTNIYGKLWYHWDQMPNQSQWMKTYLDPEDTGEEVIEGLYVQGKITPEFGIEKDSVWAAEPVSFVNISSGAVTSDWEFPGGTPASYTGKTPPPISYNTPGSYSVKLIINKGTADEKIIEKTNCIKVYLKNTAVREIKYNEITAAVPMGTMSSLNAKLYTAALYHKEELTWINGDITQIDWKCNNALTEETNKRKVKIYLKHVPASLINIYSDYTTYGSVLAGAKLVASYTDIKNTTGYQGFPFNMGDNKFTYNNDSSLLVITEVEYATNGTRNPLCYTSSLSYHTRYWQTSATGTIASTANGTRYNYRPNIRFTNKLVVSTPIADFQMDNSGEYLLFEGFDNKSIPTSWTIEKPGYSANQWRLVTILDESIDIRPFNKIEPGPSRQSLRVMYDEKKNVNTWLKSPEVTITDPATIIDFYLYYSGGYLSGGCVNFCVSEDGGVSWTIKWTTGKTDIPSLHADWRKQRLLLSEYVGKTIRFAWQYVGTYGDNIYLDGIKVFIPGNKITTFEGESVSFTDRSVGSPVLWQWALPGSNMPNSSVQDLYATYMQIGSYTPSLQVTNNLGVDTKNIPNGIIVKARIPNTQFYSTSKNRYTTYPLQGQFLPLSGGVVKFTDTTLYNPTSVEWILQGATPSTSTATAINTNYPAGQNSYDVTFKATNSGGTKDLTIPGYVQVGGTAKIWNIPYGDPGLSILSGNNEANKQFHFTGSSPDWSEVAEYFKGSTPCEISKISLFIVKLNTVNLTVNVYSDNKGNPGTKIASYPILNANILDSTYTTITLPTPVGVDSSFFISVSGLPPFQTNLNQPRATIASSTEKQTANNCTAYVCRNNEWIPTTSLNKNVNLSMNIVVTLTQTSAQLTSASTFSRKDVDASVGELSFTTTGASWWATADPWITLSSQNGTISGGAGSLTFVCQDNTSAKMRSGTITVYPGGVPFTINVTQGGSYPANFIGKYDDRSNRVRLSWGDGQVDPISTSLFDGAENHSDFEINSHNPNYWSYIDADQAPTYIIQGTAFPNMQNPMAFMVFNPSATIPALSASSFSPHSGNKYFACIAANPAPNNDWMISPLVEFSTSFTFSFWAKSSTLQYGKERFNVYYSTTGKEREDFIHKVTSDAYTEVPETWTQYTYSLPVEARYVAINCVSNDAFIFMVDDIFIGTGSAPTAAAPNNINKNEMSTAVVKAVGEDTPSAAIPQRNATTVTKYKIFKDGVLLSSNLTEEIYYDASSAIGTTPCYSISAIYEGNSFFESVTSPDQCVFMKSPITITGDNKQITETDVLPTFTASFAGQLLNTDIYSDIADIAYTCEVTTDSPAGTYVITTTATNKLSDKYTVTSKNGVLNVNSYPSIITQQPVGGTVCQGGSYTFSVQGNGLETNYQWQKQVYNSWQNIAGANGSSYTINNVRATDAGNYRVLINGRTAVAPSNSIALEVGLPKEEILVFDWDQVPTVNCNPATNGGHTFISFQWYKNGIAISGATKPYILAQEAAVYDCKVTANDGRIFHLCNYSYQPGNTSFSVYPNPASLSEQVIVKQANAAKGSVINIFNINGTLIKGGIPMNNPETSLYINDLIPGMYIIQVAEPNGLKKTTKLLVQ